MQGEQLCELWSEYCIENLHEHIHTALTKMRGTPERLLLQKGGKSSQVPATGYKLYISALFPNPRGQFLLTWSQSLWQTCI